MRLLQRDSKGRYDLTQDLPPAGPYAILSHTWGPDEVIFTDLAKSQLDWQQKDGYEKIKFCADKAMQHGLQYFWIDTCCIDKSDSIELQTAINSMFRWYREAEVCYVYLSDVSDTQASGVSLSTPPWETAFRNSRYFTRGWTLQELIAPNKVEFYSKEGSYLGDKQSLETLIRDVTGIPASALRGTPLSTFPVTEREAWVRNRQTKHPEDMAYSLFGIFDVHMPLIYGEGRDNAQRRLREEVQKAIKGPLHNDFSITFSLAEVPETQHFIAREDELTEIRGALNSDGSRRVVVLHGLGGIGKTQLAVKYTKRYREEYSAILWFNIKDEASIQQSFTKVARQILQQYPGTTRLSALNLEQDYKEVIEAVKSWLSFPGNTRWLLIYDNYDNPRSSGANDAGIDINHYLPTAYQGSVIITTRISQLDTGHLIQIKKLEAINDNFKILSTTSGRQGLEDGKTLELDGLPLALVTAGTYLRRVSSSLRDYLRLYQNSWKRLHTSTPKLGSYQDRTLCSTWQVSYEQILEQNPLAAHILRWWAYFDNEDIWFELLRPTLTASPQWMNDLADELNFNDAMGTLHDYGFVEPHASTLGLIGSRGYSIHGCLHAWTIHILNQDSDRNLAKLAVQCVASRVPTRYEHQSWLLQKRLSSHARKCLVMIEDHDHGLDQAFYRLGILYRDQGKLRQAEALYKRAIREYIRVQNHVNIRQTLNALGFLYIKQGKLRQARAFFLKAFQWKKQLWRPDHVFNLVSFYNLGFLYSEQNKLQQAEDMLVRALRGLEKAAGTDHKATLAVVDILSQVYVKQGKLQQAEHMSLRAVRGFEKVWGSDHNSTLAAVRNLGNCYLTQDKLQQAEEMYVRALRGCEKVWGPDDTRTLEAAGNLGSLYLRQDRLEQAEDILKRVVLGWKKFKGPRDNAIPRPVVDALRNLNTSLIRQGKPNKALKYTKQAYANSRAPLGPSDGGITL